MIAGVLLMALLVGVPTASATQSAATESTSTGGLAAARPNSIEPHRPHLTVHVRSTVSAGGHVLTRLAMRVGMNAHAKEVIGNLLKTSAHYSYAYRADFIRTLKLGGLMSHLKAEVMLLGLVGLPQISLSRHTATIVARYRDFVPWEEHDKPAVIRMQQLRVPPGDRFVFDLDAEDDPPIAVWPLPQRADGHGHMLWEWQQGELAGVGIHFNGPAEPYGNSTLRKIFSLLAEALPFLFVVLIMIITPAATRALMPSLPLGTFAFAAGILVFGSAAYYGLAEIAGPGPEDASLVFVPTVALMVFVTLCVGVPVLTQVVAVTVMAAGLALILIVQDHTAVFVVLAPVRSTVEKLSTTELIVGYTLAGVLLIASIGAVVRWLMLLLPPPNHFTRRLERSWGWILAGVLAVAVAVTVEMVVTTGSQKYWSSLVSGEPGAGVGQGYFLEGAPLIIANLARALSVPVLLFGLANWFWLRAGEGEVMFEEKIERALFGLLFAASVVGLSGRLHDYEFPLGFILAVPLVAVGLHRLRTSHQAVALKNEAAMGEADGLLKLSVKLSAIRRSLRARGADIEDDTGAPGEVARLGAKREGLLRIESLEGESPGEKEAEMVAVGLTGRKGARWRWDSLGSLRWLIISGPAAYAAYAVIHENIDGAVSVHRPAGAAFLTASLIAQISVWPIAAWGFVVVEPRLPGRIGPFKGVVAGLFCAIPAGIASLFVDTTNGPESWLFVPAEMTLMFVALGLALDYKAFRRAHADLGELGELYSVTSWRATTAYLVPLTVLLVGVIHGLATGSGASSLTKLFLGAESFVPPTH